MQVLGRFVGASRLRADMTVNVCCLLNSGTRKWDAAQAFAMRETMRERGVNIVLTDGQPGLAAGTDTDEGFVVGEAVDPRALRNLQRLCELVSVQTSEGRIFIGSARIRVVVCQDAKNTQCVLVFDHIASELPSPWRHCCVVLRATTADMLAELHRAFDDAVLVARSAVLHAEPAGIPLLPGGGAGEAAVVAALRGTLGGRVTAAVCGVVESALLAVPRILVESAGGNPALCVLLDMQIVSSLFIERWSSYKPPAARKRMQWVAAGTVLTA